MIIAVHSRFQVEHVLKVATRAVGFALGLFLGAGSLFLIFYPWNETASLASSLSSGMTAGKGTAGKNGLAYDAIGTGPLSLCCARGSQFVPNLGQEILILARNSRPDVKSKEAYLLVGLRSSNQEQVVLSGQSLFLNCETKENGKCSNFYFSSEPTSLWVKPQMLDTNEVLVEVGKQIALEESAEMKEEKTQFILQDSSRLLGAAAAGLKKQELAYVKSLKQAKWWGQDMLIQKYGGDDYRLVKEKHKIEFSDPSYICFVEAGDYLTWDKDRWTPVSLEEAKSDVPLLHIKALNVREMEIEAWDETGFHKMQTKLSAQTSQKLNVKPEAMPAAIRLKSGAQVTCTLGKRRVILREGDWLLKTASHWRVLKNIDEIDDFLQHRIKGELFIFDALEKQEGKVQLKGHIFDDMRTQMLPVSLPIVQEKKTARLHKKSSTKKTAEGAAKTP